MLGRRGSLSKVPLLAFVGRQDYVLGPNSSAGHRHRSEVVDGFLVFGMMVQRTRTAWFSRLHKDGRTAMEGAGLPKKKSFLACQRKVSSVNFSFCKYSCFVPQFRLLPLHCSS